jgi:hypothetical protein
MRLDLRWVIAGLLALAGTASAAPMIQLDPTTLEYGEVTIGDGGFSPSYTVTNVGNAPLTVTDMLISGPDADQLHFDNTADPFCGAGQDCATDFALAPGQARSFSVSCEPSRTGPFTASLAITSDAANATGNSTVGLVCTGLARASLATLTVTPSPIDFGVGYAEAPPPLSHIDRTFRITNSAPAFTAPVNVDLVPPLLNGNGSFVCPSGTSVAAGAFTDVVITFQWHGGELSTTPLVLRNHDTPSEPPLLVPMTAEAAYGIPTFESPPSTDPFVLPEVELGQTATFAIRIRNTGHTDLYTDTTSASSSGGPATIELVGAPPPFTIVPPNGVVEYTLSCTPTTYDGASGTLQLSWMHAAHDFDFIQFLCPVIQPYIPARDDTYAELPPDEEPPPPVPPRADHGCAAGHPGELGWLALVLGLLVRASAPRSRRRR